MSHCPGCGPKEKKPLGKYDIVVALAGNANVGKSMLFNNLTGVGQIIGNWPGKTVERAEGILQHNGVKAKIIDLPGIYSFSTFSTEEVISRDFVALEKPDVVVNVVDSTSLERNLFFTLQLLELNAPLVVALNQSDLLEQRKIKIDIKKLERILGTPVLLMSAKKGKGLSELADKIIEVAKGKKRGISKVRYGSEVEKSIKSIESRLIKLNLPYPLRWTAIKLLEKDPAVLKLVSKKDSALLKLIKKEQRKLEKTHGHSSSVVMSSERYSLADRIAKDAQVFGKVKYRLTEKIDNIVLHPVFGHVFVVAVLGGLLYWTFIIGAWISGVLSNWLAFFEQLEPVVSGSILNILWNGAFGGFVAGVTLVIPYVLPFYLLLALLEDSGYLPRMAVMLDRGMHKLGLHGKAIIPLILGYGCSVPACFSCRIMETQKQKLITAFLITLIPCTARTVVILGLVAAFVNIWWALALFAFDILLIILIGRLAFQLIPGESVGLIMEVPDYRLPSIGLMFKQTWLRTKSLLWVVFPAYIIGSALLQLFYALGWLEPVNSFLSPITVQWLGLPAVTGILLIFGFVRKEFTILMLAVIFQTTDFASILTPLQMIVLALVTMIYIPCLATIIAIAREFNWKKAATITLVEVAVAIILGGLTSRLLELFF